MAAGYETLGTPDIVLKSIENVNQRNDQKQQQQQQLQQQQDQFNQKQQQAKNSAASSATDYITKNYTPAAYDTGVPQIDNVTNKSLDAILNKSKVDLANGVDPSQVKANISAQTQMLGGMHAALLNKVKDENANIAALVKDDPSLNALDLKNAVYGKIASAYLNPNGTDFNDPSKVDPNILTSNLSSTLANSGNFTNGAQTLTNFFANQKTQKVSHSFKDAHGGGYTVNADVTPFDDIAQYSNGKFNSSNPRNVNTVYEEESLNPNDPNAQKVKVFPQDKMDQLYSTPKYARAINSLYNTSIANPKSSLYTDKDSPLYGQTPQQVQQETSNGAHPIYKQIINGWLVRNIAQSVSPSRAYVSSINEDRALKSAGGVDGAGIPYTDLYSDVVNSMPTNGHGITTNQLSPKFQDFAAHAIKNDSSKASLGETAVFKIPNSDKYGLYYLDNGKPDGLITQFDKEQLNTFANPTMKAKGQVIKDARQGNNPKPQSTPTYTNPFEKK